MKNRWVIPDVHGYLMTLKYLVEDRIALSKSDALYFLGDYIDRGYDNVVGKLQSLGADIRRVTDDNTPKVVESAG
jgi:hypothetical protein